MRFEQQHPVLGRIAMPNVPFRFSDVDVTPQRPVPLLGQHNREILRALLEYAPDQISELERDGILYAEETVGRLALHGSSSKE